jgi:uncharacterized protein
MREAVMVLQFFHPDELEAQRCAGGGAQMAGIRSFMPDQHRSFFELLPNIFVATRDASGWPLATMLTGAPGFVHTPDATTLRIEALPDAEDPAAPTFTAGGEIGLLGIDFGTRRRNRANGHIGSRDAGGFSVAVALSFGNCPQHIHRRQVRLATPAPQTVETLGGLDPEAQALIDNAETFFIASAAAPGGGAAGGCDISHRGGRPGFVRIDGDTLTIPDFRGNRYFNTFGNLLGEPRAALLFIDFQTGDLLQLQGKAEIDWSDAAAQSFAGAERSWQFHVTRGWRRRAASPLRWTFVDYSPFTLPTGTWHDTSSVAAQ